MSKSAFLLLLAVTAVVAKYEEYDGYVVYDVNVKNTDQVQFIGELQNSMELDVWSYAVPGRTGQIFVSKEKRAQFEESLTDADIEFIVAEDNIKEKIELEESLLQVSSRKNKRSKSGGLSYDAIHTYEVVDAFLEELAQNYPDTVTLVNAGQSFEGRDIKYLRISTDNFQDRSKPIVFLQSLLHAREWVTLPPTLYAIEKLVIDVTESDLIENLDWIILPIANPDGYVYTHDTYRFWRKNRRTGLIIGDICEGVDLNRNFAELWGGTGSSGTVCSETYRGPSAFSESETAIIRDIFTEFGNRIEVYIDIHSYGSLILYGYGSGVLPSNALSVHYLGVQMAEAIDSVKWTNKPNYTVGNSALVLYQASGVSNDYAFSVGVPYSYCYELPGYRNAGSLFGFLVQPEFIEQAAIETWEGIKASARFILLRRKSDS